MKVQARSEDKECRDKNLRWFGARGKKYIQERCGRGKQMASRIVHEGIIMMVQAPKTKDTVRRRRYKVGAKTIHEGITSDTTRCPPTAPFLGSVAGDERRVGPNHEKDKGDRVWVLVHARSAQGWHGPRAKVWRKHEYKSIDRTGADEAPYILPRFYADLHRQSPRPVSAA